MSVSVIRARPRLPKALLILVMTCIAPVAMAQQPSQAELYDLIRQLQQKVEALESKLAEKDSASTAATPTNQQALEQKVAEQQEQIDALAQAQDEQTDDGKKVHIGGYGELHYNHLEADNSANDLDQIDVHRFVLFLGYDFTDDWRFFSEVELEHALAGESKPGEVELEQAYVERDLLNDTASVKAGLFLLPVGILNETHEPPTFYGVERNDVESIIIPSTWWAGGGAYTQRFGSGWQWDIALHEGLMMPTTGGSAFRVRSGRQKTAEANSEDLAATTRIKYTGIPGVELAASVQYQKDPSQGSGDGLDSGLLYQAHVAVQRGRFGFRALYAGWDFDIDEAIGLANGVAQATLDRAEDQNGWYVEPSWKVLETLGIYARYEDIEAAREQDNFDQWQVGLNYWPHESIVFKVDWRERTHDIITSQGRDFSGFDLGVGYQF